MKLTVFVCSASTIYLLDEFLGVKEWSYDALLYQYLGIYFHIVYSTLYRMHSCCSQGSGPDSQQDALDSTDNPK